MKVGIQARLKNGILWEAAQKMGSQAALARHLNISVAFLGDWINFKRVPEFDQNQRARDRYAEIEAKLLALTGCDLAAIFPPEIRGKAFLKREKRINAIVEMPVEQLAAAGAVPQLPPAPDALIESKDMKAALDFIVSSLRPRQQQILRYRFGLNGEDEHTLDECAQQLGITRGRVSQIERTALARLRHPAKMKHLRDAQASVR